MYVCVCNAITDSQIRASVAAGAQSLTDLKNQLGVATCCGCCSDLATSFLAAPTSLLSQTNSLKTKNSAFAMEYVR